MVRATEFELGSHSTIDQSPFRLNSLCEEIQSVGDGVIGKYLSERLIRQVGIDVFFAVKRTHIITFRHEAVPGEMMPVIF